jgi:hypothetical protein
MLFSTYLTKQVSTLKTLVQQKLFILQEPLSSLKYQKGDHPSIEGRTIL